jgi:serine/threonine protein phosphatase PrpC
VISVPEIIHATARTNSFLLLACDGIFEALSNSDVSSIIGRHLCETRCADMSVTLMNLLNTSLEAGSRGPLLVFRHFLSF